MQADVGRQEASESGQKHAERSGSTKTHRLFAGASFRFYILKTWRRHLLCKNRRVRLHVGTHPLPPESEREARFSMCYSFVVVSISSFQNKLDSNRLRMANQVAAPIWCFCFITLRHKLSISYFGTVVIGATGIVTIYTNIEELNLRKCGQVFLNFVRLNITHLNSINILTKF